MATLTANITASATLLPVSAEVEIGFYTIDSENIYVTGMSRGADGRAFTRRTASVDRAVGGSTAATHLSAATLTRYYPDAAGGGGGGGVTVNSTPITNIVAAEAVIDGDEATVVTFPAGWSFDGTTLLIDTDVSPNATITFQSGVFPDNVERGILAKEFVGIYGEDSEPLFVADVLGTITTLAAGGVFQVEAGFPHFRINGAGEMGFYGNTPVAQPAAIADAADEPEAVTQLNLALQALRDLGLIAT